MRRAFVRNGLLHRREGFAVQPLDRHQMFAVHFAQRHQARCDWFVDDTLAFQLTNEHRAGPTIPLSAALFGSHELCPLAHVIQDQRARRVGRLNFLVVEVKVKHSGRADAF